MSDIYQYSGPEIIAHIGKQYRVYRQQLQLTQRDVAEKAGLSIMTIQKFETGNSHDMSFNTLLRLLRLVGRLSNIECIPPNLSDSLYFKP